MLLLDCFSIKFREFKVLKKLRLALQNINQLSLPLKKLASQPKHFILHDEKHIPKAIFLVGNWCLLDIILKHYFPKYQFNSRLEKF